MKELEPRLITPKRILKAVLWSSVILAGGFGAKEAIQIIDSVVRPTYIVNGGGSFKRR